MMRRSPLGRKTGLNTGKGLARKTQLKQTNGLQRASRLKPRSKKTAAVYVERRALVAELFAEPVVCEVPWCTSTATDPHEPLTRARGGSILDRDNIRLICGIHHDEIHQTEPSWAYELGFLKHAWDEVV